jgi:hypothetical protein
MDSALSWGNVQNSLRWSEREGGVHPWLRVHPPVAAQIGGRCEEVPGFLLCFGTWSHYVPQAGLELRILLPHSPDCWDYRCALLRSASSVSSYRFVHISRWPQLGLFSVLKKKKTNSQALWLASVISTTQEAEVGRIEV